MMGGSPRGVAILRDITNRRIYRVKTGDIAGA
jgi:hypothetical protein